MSGTLALGAVYERRVAASLERVWENVHDWEHLPWLHGSSFCGIHLEEAAAWGWRARVQVPPREAPRELLIELRREPDAERYHTRTLEGPGAGGDTITTLTALGERETAVRVEFWLPMPPGAEAEAIGRGMQALYARLWDEDEAMMCERQRILDAPAPAHSRVWEPIALGPADALRSELPRILETPAGPLRIVEHEGRIVAHTLLCPHLGGPLAEARIEDGCLVCPWHGYRFSLLDGRNPDGRPCRLPTPIPVRISTTGHAELPAPTTG